MVQGKCACVFLCVCVCVWGVKGHTLYKHLPISAPGVPQSPPLPSDRVRLRVPVSDLQDASSARRLHGEDYFLPSEGRASCAEGTVTVQMCTTGHVCPHD